MKINQNKSKYILHLHVFNFIRWTQFANLDILMLPISVWILEEWILKEAGLTVDQPNARMTVSGPKSNYATALDPYLFHYQRLNYLFSLICCVYFDFSQCDVCNGLYDQMKAIQFAVKYSKALFLEFW